MAVDKRITGVSNPDLEVQETVDIESSDVVNRLNDDEEIEVQVQETDEGGAVIDFDPSAMNDVPEFADNLAEFLSEDILTDISTDIVGEFKADRESRHEWEFSYTR